MHRNYANSSYRMGQQACLQFVDKPLLRLLGAHPAYDPLFLDALDEPLTPRLSVSGHERSVDGCKLNVPSGDVEAMPFPTHCRHRITSSAASYLTVMAQHQ